MLSPIFAKVISKGQHKARTKQLQQGLLKARTVQQGLLRAERPAQGHGSNEGEV